MPAPIDFYFEFASPYGYFASMRIDAIAANYDREVQWRPITLAPALVATAIGPNATVPIEGDYFKRDAARSARLLGLPLTWPDTQPANGLAASRFFYALLDRDVDLAKGYAQAVFHAQWGLGGDVSTPEAVAEIAAVLGFTAEEVATACAEPGVQKRLLDESDAASALGVLGSPWIVVDGEPFWGADRLDQVERWLATGGW